MTLPDLTNYPELHEYLWSAISEILQDGGSAEGLAQRTAFAITEHIRTKWGGRQIYLARPAKKAEEDAASGELFDQGEQPVRMAQVYLEELRLAAVGILTEAGLAEDFALPIVELVREELSKSTYVARGAKYDLERRDRAIYLGWDGTLTGKFRLMEKYGIGTEARFYQIVNRQAEEANPPLLQLK